jgi:murein L,D-transpeptidase YcbB/YkuD
MAGLAFGSTWRNSRFRMAALVALAVLLQSAIALAQLTPDAVREELARRIADASSQSLKTRLAAIDVDYAARGYAPVWMENGLPGARAREMVAILNRAGEDGLHKEDYDAEALFQKLGSATSDTLADLEVHLTTAAVSFAQHMSAGRIDPRDVNREIVLFPAEISPAAIVANLRRTTRLAAYFRLLAPHTQRYERLRSALAAYRRIEEAGGWTQIPDGPVLKPGASDPRIPLIRRRMVEEGLLAAASDSDAYDPELAKAVIAFQERMGLEALGTIGKQTTGAMNVPVADRIVTMELNLERNRWMQNDFGPYHIFANLADQVVKLVRNDRTLHAEVIQVGQPYHRTPVFSDKMEYLEINPYWGVPPSIAINEYLPKLRRNPGVLAAQNIAVFSGGKQVSASSVNWSAYGRGNFPFTLRQNPGKGNALGRIKFMFPNEFNVYMHDTPAKSKFDAAQRYFSHGCLRLRDPLTMAEKILVPEGWDRKRIDAVVASGRNTVVRLKEQIPVHIAYLTAFVNKDGSVNFREDVYGRDKILADALAKVRGR